MTWIVHALHPQAPGVPVTAEVEGVRLASEIAQVFEAAGCSTAYWPKGEPL